VYVEREQQKPRPKGCGFLFFRAMHDCAAAMNFVDANSLRPPQYSLGMEGERDQRVPCTKCGALILERTASKTNGLCLPCKGGYRARIEAGKNLREQERERELTDPDHKLWLSLVEDVFHSPLGFEGLSHPKKLYFALGCLEGELYNGGFHQYFFNSSGSYYAYAEEALITIGAFQTLELLQQAKVALFSSGPVPVSTTERRMALSHYSGSHPEGPDSKELDRFDKRYWLNLEQIGVRMKAFARDNKLIAEAA